MFTAMLLAASLTPGQCANGQCGVAPPAARYNYNNQASAALMLSVNSPGFRRGRPVQATAYYAPPQQQPVMQYYQAAPVVEFYHYAPPPTVQFAPPVHFAPPVQFAPPAQFAFPPPFMPYATSYDFQGGFTGGGCANGNCSNGGCANGNCGRR